MIKYKARLVATGYLQVIGIDYDETFISVTRLVETMFIVLPKAAHLCSKIHQMEVKTAFLNDVQSLYIYHLMAVQLMTDLRCINLISLCVTLSKFLACMVPKGSSKA